MNQSPRVAFMPDTFHEVNGVALTSRQLESFARRRQIPFLSIHCGPSTGIVQEGALTTMQLHRSSASIPLDSHLEYDPFLMRYAKQVAAQIRQFGANLVHITGPGDMGVLGSLVAWKLNLPLVISWHTSLHEYAGRRLERMLSFLGPRLSGLLGALAQRMAFAFLKWFYRRAKLVLAPNQELVEELRNLTRKPVYLMQRGIETDLFNPAKRTRVTNRFRIGYVGRLTPEKNVRFLAELGSALQKLGRAFEIVIVGQGNEEAWLRANVPHATFTGVLRGEELAEEYANMDLFVFPSTTDTFGNVILEALASGVPAVVTNGGGPKYLVQPGVTGFVASSAAASFIKCVNSLMMNLDVHHRMRESARHYALGLSWDGVFQNVFRAYDQCLAPVKAKSVNGVVRVNI